MKRKPLEVIVLIGALLAAGYFLFLRGGDVSGSDARSLVQNGALLLDVRTPGEFASGHIDGAVNIPVQELEERIGELPPKDRPVVVYCQSGGRSSHAARMLTRAGFQAVHDLGAMSSW